MITGDDKRFKNLEKKVGGFILVALLTVLGVVSLILFENDLFKPTYDIWLTSPKGTGFSPGMPIKLSGFRIGRVKSITLNESASVEVVLQIGKRYSKWIRKDSVASLKKEGMIGDYIIEISSGVSQELIPENGQIAASRSKGLDELAEEFTDKFKPVLMDIRDIIAYANSSDGDLKQTIRRLNDFAGNLEDTRQNADLLITGTRQKLDNSFGKFDLILTQSGSTLAKTGPVLDKLNGSLAQVEQKLPDMLLKVDRSLTHMDAFTNDLKAASSQALPHLPNLIDKTEIVIDQGSTFMEGVQDIWPFGSSMVPQEEKRLIRGDSHD